MTQREIRTLFEVCTPEELPAEDRALVEAAKAATASSYSPYSKFRVGAAIRLANGETIAGSNQENVAYPSGTCAERTALFYASSRYPGVPMEAIAIAAFNEALRKEGIPEADCFQASPISPCGACRQALLEYEHRFGPIKVILYGAAETYVIPSVASLLPFSFVEF